MRESHLDYVCIQIEKVRVPSVGLRSYSKNFG